MGTQGRGCEGRPSIRMLTVRPYHPHPWPGAPASPASGRRGNHQQPATRNQRESLLSNATLAGCLAVPPHPFSQRLRSAQMLAVWLPKDSQTSCSDLRRLFERSALARREFRRTPAFAPSAGCPERFAKRSFRGRWLQGTFFPLSFLPCSKKVGRPPGRDPASRSQQTPQRQLEKQANQSRAKRRLTRHDWRAQTPPHNADQKNAKSAHRHRASPLAPAAPAAPTPCQSTTAWARWKTRLPAMTSRPCR